MKKSGVLLLLVLICVAFLVSCGRNSTEEVNKGELVRLEAVGKVPAAFFLNNLSLTAGGWVGIILHRLIMNSRNIRTWGYQ